LTKIINILLVEDDPDDVELLETAFHEYGTSAKFIVITQGDQVLPFLEGNNQLPDIILLDLNLPKVHGKVILANIKSITDFRNIPVVILTTSSAQSEIDYCLSAGAESYFTKPTSIKDFATIVGTVMAIAQK